MGGRAGGRGPVTTAAAAALLALALLTGCGSGSDDGDGDGAAGGSRDTASSPSSEPDDGGEEPRDEDDPDGEDPEGGGTDGTGNGSGDSSGADSGGGEGEKVPEVPLEFTEEEEKYLESQEVPTGTDPAAVMELGQEACDRIAYLARIAPETVADAVDEGEIPGAEDAVRHLCPEHADLLD
ncbi:hypothetical protein [Streptomyces sp. SM14]|uniref:hypothetical protein n=1 Tax=Streptomyces sp. SM14 TaxID=1736045 RepID=UPI000CD5B9A9|nr:hypothetical protein [Streptomyces sp. SM14]